MLYICNCFPFFHSGLLHILRKTCLNLGHLCVLPIGWEPIIWDMIFYIRIDLCASTTIACKNYRFRSLSTVL